MWTTLLDERRLKGNKEAKKEGGKGRGKRERGRGKYAYLQRLFQGLKIMYVKYTAQSSHILEAQLIVCHDDDHAKLYTLGNSIWLKSCLHLFSKSYDNDSPQTPWIWAALWLLWPIEHTEVRQAFKETEFLLCFSEKAPSWDSPSTNSGAMLWEAQARWVLQLSSWLMAGITCQLGEWAILNIPGHSSSQAPAALANN